MKVLLVWDRLGEYHIARWKALGKLLGEENVHLAQLAEKDELYHWGKAGEGKERVHSLSEKSIGTFDLFTRLRSFRSLHKWQQFDAFVLSGYGKIEYILFILLARWWGKKVILFAESWYRGNRVFDLVKGMFLRYWVSGFFVSGKRALEHFNERLKVPVSKIETGYSVVDNEHFATDYIGEAPKMDRPYLLCVARYAKEKNLVPLVRAYRSSQLSEKWNLVLMGDGPQRPELEQEVSSSNSIHLLGWKSYAELPAWYQSAGALVLASTFEPWGLVVNEAMAAALPVIVSEQCGCSPDLIAENGIVFDANNHADLKKVLDQLSEYDRQQLHDMGNRSKEIIFPFSVNNWSKKIHLLLQ